MADLRDLYQEIILDHGRKPRNYRRIENATSSSDGYNPLCGDKVAVYLLIRDNVVEDAAFQGAGCAISMASASLMTQAIKGKTPVQAALLFERFHDLVTGQDQPDGAEELGKLQVFSGVREFPVRIKCATLPWHTFKAAMEGQHDIVSTE